jgi:hypothetical protein
LLGKIRFENILKERLTNGKQQMDRLLGELEEVWSFLEDGMPGMETDLEPYSMKERRTSTSTSTKRKRRLTKGEKIREGIRNRCKELDTNMARWMVDLVMDQVAVEHNCQGSAASTAGCTAKKSIAEGWKKSWK